MESPLYLLPVVVSKTFHVLALAHDVEYAQNFLLVLLEVLDPRTQQILEVQEYVRLQALHQIYVILGQLEGRLLEI